MICPNCGKPISGKTRLCSYCFHEISDEELEKMQKEGGDTRAVENGSNGGEPARMQQERASIRDDNMQEKKQMDTSPVTVYPVSHEATGSTHSRWKTLSVLSLLCGIVTFALGIYKMFWYENPESSILRSVNAYVGGDAYNYIINGAYATAFFVLTAMFTLAAIGMMGLHYLSRKKNRHSI